MKNPKNIAITGASSGIGKALALYYAAPGVTLYLHGRNKERLEETLAACKARGASVFGHTGDVTDAAGTAAWIEGIDAQNPIDLLVANAGISAGTGGIHGETLSQVQNIFSTNIDGVVNSVQPMLEKMLARKRGQIGIMASLAGFRGLPSSPAYSASKACVRVYGEGLRGHVAKHGVGVTVLCPGYIKTPMTAVNDFPMPGIMDVDRAAAHMARGLAKNKSRVAFPFFLYFTVWLMALLPPALTDPIFARLPAKPAAE